MKILSRNKLRHPLYLGTGDTLKVTYSSNKTGEQVLTTAQLNEADAMTVDEAVCFADNFEGKRTLGGFVIEKE